MAQSLLLQLLRLVHCLQLLRRQPPGAAVALPAQ